MRNAPSVVVALQGHRAVEIGAVPPECPGLGCRLNLQVLASDFRQAIEELDAVPLGALAAASVIDSVINVWPGEAEISAKDIARIITQIKKLKIPAVFLENVADPRLMQRISAESGAKIGGTLYSDALSDDKGPASTYLDMMRHNLRQFGAALNS